MPFVTAIPDIPLPNYEGQAFMGGKMRPGVQLLQFEMLKASMI